MADKYDLAYISLDELIEQTTAPASNDFTVRYDDSGSTYIKVDASDLNATLGTTATKTELDYLDITTLGTGAASKAVVLDASGDYTYPSTGTIVYPASSTAAFSASSTLTLSGTVTRTPAALTATVALTQALNANRINYVTGTSAAAYTLPEATGTGDQYILYMGEVNVSGMTLVTPDLVNSLLYGKANMLDVDATAATAFFTVTAGDSNTVTWDGTTKGGQIGDFMIATDLATDVFAIHVECRVPAGSNVASPFSAA